MIFSLILFVLWGTGKNAFLSDSIIITILVADIIQIFVATATHVDQNGRVLGKGGGQFHGVGETVSGFECRNDTLQSGQLEKGVNDLLVGGKLVRDAAQILEKGMLGTDSGVIKPRGAGMYGRGFSGFLVQKCIALHSVNDSRSSQSQSRRVVALSHGETPSGRFDADHLDILVFQKCRKEAERVASAPDAGHQIIGLVIVAHLVQFGKLLLGFVSDNGLEISHHHGKGVGTNDAPDTEQHILGIGHVGPKGRIDGLLQRFLSVGRRNDGRSQHLHAADVGPFLFDVDLSHVDFAVQSQQRSTGRQGDPVLAGTGFGNDLGLAHFLGKQNFAKTMVDLVGSGVIQIFSFQKDLGSSQVVRQPLAVKDGGGTAHKVTAEIREFLQELWVVLDGRVFLADFLHDWDERGREIGASVGLVLTKVSIRMGQRGSESLGVVEAGGVGCWNHGG
mmetsp:Transcript_21830/g.44857  ORF Transcript_21830/g.44857 Transcript_21830/m.44857 type:complete len:448 (-) Transcript_21830:28-1371(-)